MMNEKITPAVVVEGLQSPEGPSFSKAGVLHFVDWDAQKVYYLGQGGELQTLVTTGGVPTGSKFHRNGTLYVADGELGIIAVSPAGDIEIKADEWQGQTFRGPNDLVFSSRGDVYFTDPKGSDQEHPIGNVFILRPSGQVEHFVGGLQFPNGITLSDDEQTLYLAETLQNRIWAFELDEHGLERSRKVFAELEGGVGPDGMAFDQEGNLFIAHFGKGVISVINPDGKLIREVDAGGKNPTNLAFWEDDLYVTEVEKGQVLRLEVGVRGQRLFGLT
jgi:gluconolactonase